MRAMLNIARQPLRMAALRTGLHECAEGAVAACHGSHFIAVELDTVPIKRGEWLLQGVQPLVAASSLTASVALALSLPVGTGRSKPCSRHDKLGLEILR